jgi:guanylate kinase
LQKAEDEMREAGKYDHVIVNDVLEDAVEELRVISGLAKETTS